MTYQIRDWNRNFENNKSREIDRCSFVCLPNKQHGMGFRRIMAELDGATIYGIWVCIVAACSQQEAPRLGWLTEDGRKNGAAWGASDIALKIGRPTNEIERCISVVSSPRIGWLAAHEVPPNCPPDADEPPNDCPSTTLEGRKEQNRRNRKKEYLVEAKEILSLLNQKSGRNFRETDENLGFLSERLAEDGVTKEGVAKMVERQCSRWRGTDQAEYMRPETLFNKTKFDAYYAAKDLPAHETNQRNHSTGPQRTTGADQRKVGIPAAKSSGKLSELLAERARKATAHNVAAKTSPPERGKSGGSTHG